MPLQYQIILAIGLAALIAITFCFLGGMGILPKTHPAGAEEWDSPYLTGFLLGLIVLALDAVAALLAVIWDYDPSHLVAPGLALLAIVVAEMKFQRVFGTSLFSWWRKLVPVPVATPPKKPWLSKTIVLNAIVAVGLLAEAKLPFLQGLLPASKYQVIAFILPFVNMVLRAYTTQGLSLGASAQSTEPGQ